MQETCADPNCPNKAKIERLEMELREHRMALVHSPDRKALVDKDAEIARLNKLVRRSQEEVSRSLLDEMDRLRAEVRWLEQNPAETKGTG